MPERAFDLRSALSILGRRLRIPATAALAGDGSRDRLLLVSPLLYSSASQVLLPALQGGSGEPTSRDVKTDVTIAESDAVLGDVGRRIELPRPSTCSADGWRSRLSPEGSCASGPAPWQFQRPRLSRA